MIKNVFLFANGNVACTDETGAQVAEWQKPLLCDHLQRMKEAGVIDAETKVQTANGQYRLDQFITLVASITCPTCGLTSYNANDIRERYCGACHQWHSEMKPAPNSDV